MMAGLTRRAAFRGALGLSAAGALAGCASTTWSGAQGYRDAIVIDGNLVVPIDPGNRIAEADAAQLRRSGLTAVKLSLGGDSAGRAETAEDVVAVNSCIAANPDLYMKIDTAADIAEAKRTGRIGLILSFESAAMLEGNVDAIDAFRASGVLVMGLSYNRTSPFASGVLAKESTGLTELGREAIARMNARGVTVDLSHSDEASSLAAIAASTRPVLITHAGCSAVHAHPRNKSDAQMRALVKRGGVMGIYELSFINTNSPQPTLEDYLAHLTHALDVCGEDHVGIGSDTLATEFETTPDILAAWEADIARRKAAGVGAPGEGPLPFVVGLNRSDRSAIIADELARKGYSSRAIDKVLGLNFLRVFKETWS